MQLNAIYLGMPHLRLPQKLLLTINSALGRINETDKRKWIMRINLTTFLLIIALAQVYAKGFGQKITLNENNAPLEKVLKSIRQQSGYEFIYDVNDLKGQKISINLNNASVEEAVKESIKDLPLAFKIVQKNIVLTRIEPSFLERIIDRFNAIDVRGVVVDSLGNPLQGATVKVKGSSTQVNTSARGEFYIANVDENAVLVVSYVGYVSREVKAEKDLGMIRMVMASAELEEVNIASTGYQKVKPNEVTGSLVVIDNKTLNQQVGTNILQRLEGVASGVLFDTKAKTAQKKSNVSVRGLASINGPQDPLIVLDGFIYEGDINNINPNLIENITILKDAATASIWGARAGNGVVVITSKKGSFNQKLQADVNLNVTVNSRPDLYALPQMASSDYIDVERFLYDKGIYNSKFTNISRPPLSPVVELLRKKTLGQLTAAAADAQINAYRNVDIRDEYNKYFYTNAVTLQYAANLRGGTNNNAFIMGIGHDRNLGETFSKFSKTNIKLENIYRPIKNLQALISAQYTNSESNSGRPTYNSITLSGVAVPYLKFADDNGNPLPVDYTLRGVYTDTAGAGKLLNWKYYPLEDYKHDQTTTKLQEIFATAGLQYRLFKFLTADISYNYERQQSESIKMQDKESYGARHTVNLFSQLNRTTGVVNYIVPLGGIRRTSNAVNETSTGRGQFNFAHTLKNHDVNAIMGAEIREFHSSGIGYTTVGYNEDPLSFANVDPVGRYRTFVNGSNQNIPAGTTYAPEITNRFISYYANAAYTFKQKYSFSASARRDGSNVFGANTNEKWKPLWSAGLGWDVSNEEFYRLEFLPKLKARITYGYSGNVDLSKSAQPVAVYQGLNANTNFRTAVINSLNNPDLRWEKVATLNLGIDFASKNDVISGSVDYYTKKGSDLYGLTTFDYTAWGSSNYITKNVADMKGNGIDVILNTRNIRREFSWNTTLLFNYNRSKTTRYNTEEAKRLSTLLGEANTITPVVGKALYSIAAYKWGGLDGSGNPQGYLNGHLSIDYAALRNEVEDQKIESGSIKYIGPALPVIYGSFINTFSWKNISLTVNISYKGGYYFRKNVLSYTALISGRGHSDYAGRWQNPGDERTTNIPSFLYPNPGQRDEFYRLAEVNVLKGDHARLQYLNLGYMIRGDKKRLFKEIQLYANASNLGILWRANQEHIDPEYPMSVYPSKAYSFGIKGVF